MAVPGQTGVDEGGAKLPEAAELVKRFSEAIMSYNAKLSGCKTGSLVQVWQPESYTDGSPLLSTQGLPFSISGVGDLLALYRCNSCRYRFSTDPSKPTLNGAIGRAYVNCQVEICSDVQCHDKSVFLRANETQQCRIHSTVVLPVFLPHNLGKPIAVIEISHHEKEVQFATIIRRMDRCLKEAGLATMDVGEIESLMGDGVGIRYQIFGPGSALATAGSSVTRLGDLAAVGGKDAYARNRATKISEPEMPPLTQQVPVSPRASTVLQAPQASVSEVNGLVSAMAIEPINMKTNNSGPVDEPLPPTFNPCQPANLCNPVRNSGIKDFSLACKEEGESCGGGSNREDSEMLDDDQHMESSLINSGSSGDSGGIDGGDSGQGIRKHDNRLGGGAGKRLMYNDLQAQFAVGLKEAATRLGICPTTLKRACRRNGISRWPSRQIAKLNKAWSQMGYKGSPPSWLVKNAIAGNLKADNLAFALNTGLHMGLAQNIESSPVTSGQTSSEFQSMSQGLSSFPSESCPASTGLLATSASELNLAATDEGFLSDIDRACDQTQAGNHTWHAGQSAGELLPMNAFRATHNLHENVAPSTLLVPSVSHSLSLDFMRLPNDFPCPSSQSLECTQRGQDFVPLLTGFDSLADLSKLLGDVGNDIGDMIGGSSNAFGE